MKSRAINQDQIPNEATPAYNNWRTNQRVLSLDDGDPMGIPVDERIQLSAPSKILGATGSRFADNTITLLVEGATGTTLTLYAIEPTADNGGTFKAFRFGEPIVTTVQNQSVQWFNLPALTYVVKVTGVVGTVRLHGGGTR